MSCGGSGYDRYRLRARAGAQQQTRQPPLLLSIDGTDRRTDRQTDGRTDTGPFYDARRILRSPARNKYASRGCSVKLPDAYLVRLIYLADTDVTAASVRTGCRRCQFAVKAAVWVTLLQRIDTTLTTLH